MFGLTSGEPDRERRCRLSLQTSECRLDELSSNPEGEVSYGPNHVTNQVLVKMCPPEITTLCELSPASSVLRSSQEEDYLWSSEEEELGVSLRNVMSPVR